MRRMMLCAAALLVACGEMGAPKDPCNDKDLRLSVDQQVQCLIHADLQAIERRLQPPKAPKVAAPKCPVYDPDEVCEGECEAARGAAAEYRRKYEAMCATAQGMCYEMEKLAHWEDQECGRVCEFFGDAPAEKGGKP